MGGRRARPGLRQSAHPLPKPWEYKLPRAADPSSDAAAPSVAVPTRHDLLRPASRTRSPRTGGQESPPLAPSTSTRAEPT